MKLVLRVTAPVKFLDVDGCDEQLEDQLMRRVALPVGDPVVAGAVLRRIEGHPGFVGFGEAPGVNIVLTSSEAWFNDLCDQLPVYLSESLRVSV